MLASFFPPEFRLVATGYKYFDPPRLNDNILGAIFRCQNKLSVYARLERHRGIELFVARAWNASSLSVNHPGEVMPYVLFEDSCSLKAREVDLKRNIASEKKRDKEADKKRCMISGF